MNDRELKRLARVLAPLQVAKMPLAAPPPRENRFGSPLRLSKVHWVMPEVVVEVTYLTWTEGGFLRAVSYQGQREVRKPGGPDDSASGVSIGVCNASADERPELNVPLRAQKG